MKKLLLLFLTLAVLSGCSKPQPQRAELHITGPEKLVCTLLGHDFKGGKINLSLPPGTYIVRFQAPGYQTKFQKITLGKREKKTLRASLTPQQGLVLINSKPSGAQVIFQGRKMGLAPVILQKLPLGQHEVKLELKGYAARTVSFQVENDRPRAVPVNLDANYGTLVLQSNPVHARVFIDGEEVGTTPYRVEREEGKYLVKIDQSGFIPQERALTVRRALQTAAQFNLKPQPGELTITSNPAGAQFFLNGEKRGVTPGTVGNLKPGVYQIRVEKSGHDNAEKSLKIVAGGHDKINFNLLSSTGSVWFAVMPSGVTVLLDGKFIGKSTPLTPGSRDTKPFSIGNLQAGQHKLVLAHPRGNPPRKTINFNVQKGQHTQLNQVNMWVANGEITYVDDSVERGAIFGERPNVIIFSPEPGITIQLPRNKVKKFRYLND